MVAENGCEKSNVTIIQDYPLRQSLELHFQFELLQNPMNCNNCAKPMPPKPYRP
jgi:hypothetical protein